MFQKLRNSTTLAIFLISLSLTVYILYETNRAISVNNITASTDVNEESYNHNNSRSISCVDRPLQTSVEENGNYLVYYNIIQANKKFKCDESVTITTMGDYTFMDNIVPLLEKWRGPISVALYSPGYDFMDTIKSIYYLRHCTIDLVEELVTFHLFHERNHTPQVFVSGIMSYIKYLTNRTGSLFNCSSLPPYLKPRHNNTYRKENNLQFGINIARNIARRGAQTHYFLASDLELYPSPGLIKQFLNMIVTTPALQAERLAFALPVFEVKENLLVPTNKSDLQEMFARGDAVFFHDLFCASCHSVPKKLDWIQSTTEDNGQISEFTRSKRQGNFRSWEPFYIGTHSDPMHDERIFWEGAGDKMVQAYAQCLLDYDFVVLENAFLVHKPGIKKKPSQKPNDTQNSKDKMMYLVKPELDYLYGSRKGCKM